MSLDRTEILHKRGEAGQAVNDMDEIYNSPEFQSLSERSRVLFVRQRIIMDDYYNILCERIQEIDMPSYEIGESVEPTLEDQLLMPFIERMKAWLS